MVNLPKLRAQDARAMGERGSDRMHPRSHHNWGSRYGRRREELKNLEPTGLLQLEELAHKTVALMEKHGTKSEFSFYQAMALLRQQYNLYICSQYLCQLEKFIAGHKALMFTLPSGPSGSGVLGGRCLVVNPLGRKVAYVPFEETYLPFEDLSYSSVNFIVLCERCRGPHINDEMLAPER